MKLQFKYVAVCSFVCYCKYEYETTVYNCLTKLHIYKVVNLLNVARIHQQLQLKQEAQCATNTCLQHLKGLG